MPKDVQFEDEFEMTSHEVGSGMSGSVRLAIQKSRPGTRSMSESSTAEERPVAVKRLKKDGLTKKQLARLFSEAQTYLKMDHPHIARLLRVFDGPETVYLVMEYCSGGSLFQRLEKQGIFTEEDAAWAVFQILSALHYCHKHPIGTVCHRDIKGENFVYASEQPSAPLKLIDFGLSRILSPENPNMKGATGTLQYMAPEVVADESYDESCDLWAVGVIAYSLLCGQLPFDGSTSLAVEQRISTTVPNELMVGKAWHSASDSAKDLIRRLLQRNPKDRPTAGEALAHPWVARSSPLVKTPTLPEKDILMRVCAFARESAIRRAVAAYFVYSKGALESKDMDKILEQFRVLDVDGDGTLSAGELSAALAETGMSEEESYKIFRHLDVDGDAKIHQSEFLAAALGHEFLQADGLQQAFNIFDRNRDGKIELREFEGVLGEKFCGQRTKDIFRQCDINGDRSIDLPEFSKVCSPKNRSLPSFS